MQRPRADTATARRALCWLAAAIALAGCGGAGSRTPDLVLLVTVDTLRADRLGAYGSELGLTPNLDALARESVVFDVAYATAPFTLPSIVSLFTSRYPQEIGILLNESLLVKEVPTLATWLRERDWNTHAVVGNFVLHASSGLDRGFDVYDDAFPQVEAVRAWPERTATATTDAILARLDACYAPCFAWVHYQDPHGPYTPPEGTRERHIERERAAPDGRLELPLNDGHSGRGGIPDYQALDGEREVAFYRAGYHAEIEYLDAEIGRLVAALREQGRFHGALVVFAADHGEGLGEDDYWFAHGDALTDPLVRVPLFIRAPGLEPGRRDDVVSLVDVAPTLMRLLDDEPIDAPTDADWAAVRGRDLFGEPGQSAPYMSTLLAGTELRFGIVRDGFKFVMTDREGVFDGRLSPLGREGVDLTAAAPQVARPLRQELVRLHGEMQSGLAETRQDLTPGDRMNLRALGYAEGP